MFRHHGVHQFKAWGSQSKDITNMFEKAMSGIRNANQGTDQSALRSGWPALPRRHVIQHVKAGKPTR
jgi:hypothetical protein